MGIIEVQGLIRKIVETPLKAVCDAQVPPLQIQWPNLPLERKSFTEYLTVQHGAIGVIALELGTNPRWQGNGNMNVVIRTPTASSLDRNDELAGIIANAYPYGVDLVRDGVRVIIDKIDNGGYGMDDAWLYSVVNIRWVVYRRQ